VLAANFSITAADGGVEIGATGPRGRNRGVLRGMALADAQAIFAAIDGARPLGEIIAALDTRFPRDSMRALFQNLAGRVLHVPAALDALARRISHHEIVRFPAQSPYTVLREYWENCADVREAIPGLDAAAAGDGTFRDALADLHVRACLGNSGTNYYGGAGAVPTVPGGYCEVRMRTGLSAGKAAFLQSELAARGLHGAIGDDCAFQSRGGIELGHTSQQGAVFHHADPASGRLAAILSEMRQSIVSIRDSTDSAIPGLLAYFHWLFLQAHPFYNVNNSIAMNIVNEFLARAGHGRLPHLLLDFLALRLDYASYEAIFRDTLERYGIPKDDETERRAAMDRMNDYHARLVATVRKVENPGH
jgi:hypothetical protein